jgi:bisphosphoglycerate-dependent phosphoglycerate mutase
LTENGVRQAQSVGHALKKLNLLKVYSSDLSRAYDVGFIGIVFLSSMRVYGFKNIYFL